MVQWSLDKAKLLAMLKSNVRAEIAELRRAYEHARETSVVSDGRMQSRYDTMGVEAAWKADSLNRNLREKSQALEYLERVPLLDAPERVAVGTIVGIGPARGPAEALYFVLPSAGGYRLKVDESGIDVLTVTFQAPLAQALVGAKLGDDVSVRPGRKGEDVVLLIA